MASNMGAPVPDISLVNYGKWRGRFDKLIATYLRDGAGVELARRADRALKPFIEGPESSIPSFTVIEAVMRQLTREEFSFPRPVSFGRYVLNRASLKRITTKSAGIAHARELYNIFPSGNDTGNHAEFHQLLKRMGIPDTDHGCTQTSTVAYRPPEHVAGNFPKDLKRQLNAEDDGHDSKRLVTPACKPIATPLTHTPSPSVSSPKTTAQDGMLEQMVSQFTKVTEEHQQQKAKLCVRVTELEGIIKARDIEIRGLRAANERLRDNTATNIGSDDRVACQIWRAKMFAHRDQFKEQIGEAIERFTDLKNRVDGSTPSFMENDLEDGEVKES